LALLSGGCGLLAAPWSAHAAATVPTAQQALAILNAQRAAIGAPAVTERSDWSAACMAHVRYMIDNPPAPSDTETAHQETPGAAGYTVKGAWAAENAVLAPGGGSWNQPAPDASSPGWPTPWETAPIHLAQLLAPQLQQVGLASASAPDGSVFSCATTWPGYAAARPATNSVLTYPANGATIYTKELASESPWTPGERVGLPDGTWTGPYLYAFAWGPFTDERTKVAATSLTGPAGPVDLRTVDVALSDGYLPPGCALLIPVNPLRGGTTYTASITFALDGVQLTHTWSFHTPLVANSVIHIGVGSDYRQWLQRKGPATVDVSTVDPHPPLVVVIQDGVAVRADVTRYDAGQPPENSFQYFHAHFRRVTTSRITVCVTSGGRRTGYATAYLCQRFE
jgi:hypothetical protein